MDKVFSEKFCYAIFKHTISWEPRPPFFLKLLKGFNKVKWEISIVSGQPNTKRPFHIRFG